MKGRVFLIVLLLGNMRLVRVCSISKRGGFKYCCFTVFFVARVGDLCNRISLLHESYAANMVCGVLFTLRRRDLENAVRWERHLQADLWYEVHVGCKDCHPEMWGVPFVHDFLEIN